MQDDLFMVDQYKRIAEIQRKRRRDDVIIFVLTGVLFLSVMFVI